MKPPLGKALGVLACDLRSLALLRVALGLALLVDLGLRAADLRAHYTDAGVLPRALLGAANGWAFPSLHGLGGGAALEAVLFALGALAAVLLSLGYRTRWMTFASWLLLASLHARNPLVLHPGDGLLLALLLLGMFLPLGARASIDAALDPAPAPAGTVLSMATAALLIQVVLVHFAGALGTRAGAPAAVELLRYVGVAAPLLAFTPWWHTPARLALLGALSLALIWSASSVGVSGPSWIALLALAALVPAAAWDWLAARTGIGRHGGLRIYYDRDCGFCHKTCLVFRSLFLLGDSRITPAQDEASVYAIMQQHNSWVVYDYNGKPHLRWHAVLLLLRRSPLWWPLGVFLSALGMGRWGDPLYELMARSRGTLSTLTAALLPFRHVPAEIGRSAQAAVALWLLAAVAISGTPAPERGRAGILHALGLAQEWSPAAQEPGGALRSHALLAQLADGRRLTIDGAPPPVAAGPGAEALARVVGAERWRLYLRRIRTLEDQRLGAGFGQGICDLASRSGVQLASFTLLPEERESATVEYVCR